MPSLNLQCTNCLRIFSPGICIEGNSSITFNNCVSNCPFCGSSQSIPDGVFKDTVEGFIEFFRGSDSSLKNANELFNALQKIETPQDLEEIKRSKQFEELKKWLPNSPEKIAAYIAIAYTIVQMFTKSPSTSINYNSFVEQYNETINIDFQK